MTAVEETSVLTRRERRAQGVIALQKATEETTLMIKKPEAVNTTPDNTNDFVASSETSENEDDAVVLEDTGTKEAEGSTAQVSTGPMPIMLPTEVVNIDDDFIDSSEEETTGGIEATEDSENRFGGFDDEDFATVPVNKNLDPAVSLALRSRSVDEIMLEEDCTTEEAVLITQQEELLRLEYFQAEIPEKVELLRLEKEEAEKLQRETALAKKEAIASKAQHGVKARIWRSIAIVSLVLACGFGITFLVLGGF